MGQVGRRGAGSASARSNGGGDVPSPRWCGLVGLRWSPQGAHRRHRVPRAVNILPNRVLGCVGQHLGEPIEQLAVAPGGQLLASCAHDQKVKFWDISALGGLVVDDYRKKKKRGGPLRALSGKAAGSGEDFFADLREETEEAEEAAGSDSD